MTLLEQALIYREKGWSIIPIKARSKLPAIPSWMKYQATLPTVEELRSWFAPNRCGIALVCGKISGVIAVDVDTAHGGTTEGLDLPVTLVSNTGGGGKHYLYKWRSGLVGAKVGIRPGIDIRSDNSYIVLPPTLHVSGKRYEWALDVEIEEAPKWLEETKQPTQATDWNKFLSEDKGEGVRNMSAAKVAGKILYDMSPETWSTLGIMAFREWNKNLNKPPLLEDELQATWESVKRTHLKNNEAPAEVAITDVDAQEIPNLFRKNKTKGTFTLAKYMTRKYDIITVGEKEREMFVYRDGIYFQAENEIIFPEIQNVLGDDVTKSAKLETYHKICDMTAKNRAIFDLAPLQFIPLRDGVYNFETQEFLPHSPNYKFKYKFPITYSATATCPKTLAFFEQVLTVDQIETVQEWIGYYFYRLYMFKKAIIFVGEGDTGKTTLLEVITYLLGRDNISSVPLQKMSTDKFSAAHLYEKHGNLVDELSAKDISDTGNFKIATGGGTITGEYKFGNQFAFHNFSKFTFACNKIPDVKDFEDDAYFNRWMVIRFENKIEKKIPNFVETLKTEQERAGLFNWAMIGLRRLLQQKEFSYVKTEIDTKEEMMRSSSSAGEFCAVCVEAAPESEITKEDMYEAYQRYCIEKKLSIYSKKAFGTKFATLRYVSDGLMLGSEGKRVEGWRNVRLIASQEQKLIEDKAELEFQTI